MTKINLMNWKSLLLFLITTLGCHGLAASETETPAKKKQKNIIFIFSDDHSVNSISAYRSILTENTAHSTPNIDRIGSTRIFSKSFVTNSICGPSRAVILSGKHSHKNGFLKNGHRFRLDQDTFAKQLRTLAKNKQGANLASYQTAIIGKWHMGSLHQKAARLQMSQSFSHWDIQSSTDIAGQGSYYNPIMRNHSHQSVSASNQYACPSEILYRPNQRCTTAIINNRSHYIEHRPNHERKIFGHNSEIMADLGIEFLKNRPSQFPLMLMLQFKAPHREWEPGFGFEANEAKIAGCPTHKYGFIGCYHGHEFPEPKSLFERIDPNIGRSRGKASHEQNLDLLNTFNIRDAKLVDTDNLVADKLISENLFWRFPLREGEGINIYASLGGKLQHIYTIGNPTEDLEKAQKLPIFFMADIENRLQLDPMFRLDKLTKLFSAAKLSTNGHFKNDRLIKMMREIYSAAKIGSVNEFEKIPFIKWLNYFGKVRARFFRDLLAGSFGKLTVREFRRWLTFEHWDKRNKPEIHRKWQQAVADFWQAKYGLAILDKKPDEFAVAKGSSNTQYKKKKILSWKYQRYMQDYLASVKQLDYNIGRVLTYIENDPNLQDNTVIIYASDQSFFLGEHGFFDKRFMYEPALRFPLLVWELGNESGEANRLDDKNIVSNLDLAKTFLSYAGLPNSEIDSINDPTKLMINGKYQTTGKLQGINLRPLIDGNKSIRGFRKLIRGDENQYFYYQYNMHDWNSQSRTYSGTHGVYRHYGLRDQRYKLIRFFYDRGQSPYDYYECYDLTTDPEEIYNLEAQDNISAKQRTACSRLKNNLEKIRIHYGAQTVNVLRNRDGL